MSEIAAVDSYRLRIPLTDPYHLSHTTISSFETVLVRLESVQQTVGWGEVTTLSGYSAETASEAQERLRGVLSDAPGQSTSQFTQQTENKLADIPFTRCAIQTAISAIERDGDRPVRAPVVGIVSASQPENQVTEAAKTQYEQGYDVIKIKIGFDPVEDAQTVNRIARTLPDPHTLRADANQAYSWSDAATFAETIEPDVLQLIEQPFETGQLNLHARLRSNVDCEVMLDEEIETETDVRQSAAADAADLVKLKMMKQGGPAATKNIAQTARQHNFDVVLGNGVQSDIGCLAEAQLWMELGLTRTGEFNGWRKQEHSLLAPPLGFEAGNLVYDSATASPSPEILERFSV